MIRRWQNRMAESSATLPVAMLAATLLWWSPRMGNPVQYIFDWLLCVLTAVTLFQLDSQNALLRVRSFLTTSVFLLLMAVCTDLHSLTPHLLCQLCTALSLYFLLHTYDQLHPSTNTLFSYLFLSLGSILWPPLLWFTPVLLWSQQVYLRSLRPESFCAALFGMLLPYAFWGSWLTGEAVAAVVSRSAGDLGAIDPAYYQPLLAQGLRILSPLHTPLLWEQSLELSRGEMLQYGVVLLFALTGSIHYLRMNYDDKIRVRMCYYTLLAVQWCVLLWIILQPTYLRELFPLLILTSTPAAAHFAALTSGWFTNAWVILCLLLLIATAAINLFSTYNVV